MLEDHPERHIWGLGRHYAGSNFFWYLRPGGQLQRVLQRHGRIVDDQLWTPEVSGGRAGLFSGAAPAAVVPGAGRPGRAHAHRQPHRSVTSVDRTSPPGRCRRRAFENGASLSVGGPGSRGIPLTLTDAVLTKGVTDSADSSRHQRGRHRTGRASLRQVSPRPRFMRPWTRCCARQDDPAGTHPSHRTDSIGPL